MQPGDVLDRRLRQLQLVVGPAAVGDLDRRRGCTGTRQKRMTEHQVKSVTLRTIRTSSYELNPMTHLLLYVTLPCSEEIDTGRNESLAA